MTTIAMTAAERRRVLEDPDLTDAEREQIFAAAAGGAGPAAPEAAETFAPRRPPRWRSTPTGPKLGLRTKPTGTARCWPRGSSTSRCSTRTSAGAAVRSTRASCPDDPAV
jgi:hypothetical protein